MSKKILSKQDILSIDDRPTKVLNVPEWGGEITLRALSAQDRDDFELSVYGDSGADRKNIRAKLCVRCIVSLDGKRMFSDHEMTALGAKSGKAMDRVFSACQKMNGLTQADVEELEKNSGTDLDDSSPTDSA